MLKNSIPKWCPANIANMQQVFGTVTR